MKVERAYKKKAKRKRTDTVFLPVKPKWANMIIRGEKQAELRKRNFPLHVTKAVIYSTEPEGKILGWYEIDDVIEMSIEQARFVGENGLQESSHKVLVKDFNNYYKGCDVARVVFMGCEFQEFHRSKCFHPSEVLPNFHIPQSFCYLEDWEFEEICEFGKTGHLSK